MRVTPAGLAAVAAALAALWALGSWPLDAGLLAPYQGQAAASPLYAFWMPRLRPQALVFAALALALVVGSARLCDPGRTSRRRFVATLVGAALLLPFALLLVRDEPGALGAQFDAYRNEEFYHDALRIEALGPFLRHYVELMPQLSLHGRHFPPGHAVLLHAIAQVFGAGTLPAGIAVLACFAAAVVLAWLALERLAPARAARQGALLLLAAPSVLDFACTSMDAVFLLFASLAWLLGLRALSSRGTWWSALGAGASLYLASFFSFSALPIWLVLGAHAIWSGRRAPRQAAARLVAVGLGCALAALAVDAATGFSILEALDAARASAHAFMAHAAGADPSSLRVPISFGNFAAFAIGSGIALAGGAAARVRAGHLAGDPWTPAAFAAFAILSLGGIYYLETERVWLFAMPWLAAVAVSAGAFDDASLRVLLVGGLAQALAMETCLFTLW